METYSNFVQLNDKKCLDEYYYFENSFSEEELKKIGELVNKYNNNLKDAIIVNSDNKNIKNDIDNSYRSSKISWIPLNNNSKWLYQKIGSFVNIANQELWDFDILGMTEMIQYGEYRSSENGHYDWHMDLGGDVINRKISVTIQLSDPQEYEGGELQFMTSRKITNAPKGKGITVIFPSYFLHRVTPVTKGIRKSLVIWITGKAFR